MHRTKHTVPGPSCPKPMFCLPKSCAVGILTVMIPLSVTQHCYTFRSFILVPSTYSLRVSEVPVQPVKRADRGFRRTWRWHFVGISIGGDHSTWPGSVAFNQDVRFHILFDMNPGHVDAE